MNIIIVDYHAIVSDGLAAVLMAEPGYNVVKKLTSGDFALAFLKQGNIDLMITDYSMPDMDGLTLVKKAREIVPELKIIVLTMHDEPAIVKDMLNAGVNGYVLKKYAQQEVVTAIEAVNRGQQFWSAEVSRALLNSINYPSEENGNISERELEVLKLLAEEMTSKQIAEKLFISERTVETHRKNLLRKTGASNAIGLVRYAYSKKLL
ncbi:MAG: response regulator transcription factor [Pedobacter sp.]|nr:MAG: response regulator transcription factor [Pedobacter sp.]